MSRLKKKTVISIAWNFLEMFLTRGILIISTILLSWFLAPEDFALLSMMAVFIQLANFSVDAGFSEALIRKKEVSQLELSSVFFVNIFFSFLIYTFFYFLAPIIAQIYQQPSLIELIRVVTLSVFFHAIFVVQKAILTRELKFKLQVKIAVPAVFISTILTVIFAYLDYGVWALIIQIVSNSFILALLYWRLNFWRPTFIFSLPALKELWQFSKYLLVARYINIPFKNMYLIVLPKFFLAGPVGLYFFAEKAKDAMIGMLVKSIQTVTYPVLSQSQDDNEKLKRGYRIVVATTSFLLMPVLLFLATLAPLLFEVFLPPSWFGAAIFLQLMCLTAILKPLNSINLNMLKVKGRSDLVFYVGVVKKIVVIAVFIYTVQIDIIAVLIGQVFTTVVNYLPNTYYSSKLIGYSIREQLADFMPSFLLSVIIAVLIYMMQGWLMWAPLFELISLILIASLFYLAGAYWLKLEAFMLAKNLLMKK